ncbi:flagellar motor switch protein FliN [bacterium]|nr:flagellar motor switch protein FliN [bacterium]
MADETLSQGDIDALLQGLDAAPPTPPAPPTAAPPAAPAPEPGGPSSKIDRAALAASETATADLGRKVELKNVSAERMPGGAVSARVTFPAVVFHATTPSGSFAWVVSKDLGGRLSDIKMGGDGSKPPDTFSDLYLSAISEFANLIFGSFLKGMKVAAALGESKVLVVESKEELETLPAMQEAGCSVITATAAVENLTEGEWIMVMSEQPAAAPAAPSPAHQPSPVMPAEAARPVQKVEFGSFEESRTQEMPANLSLLLDVPMNVTVELGRTKMTVQDVLNLGSGSIVELDKLAGEPVDFMVNGKLIAKGEVVVIDENFGLRITDIVSPMERFRGMSI